MLPSVPQTMREQDSRILKLRSRYAHPCPKPYMEEGNQRMLKVEIPICPSMSQNVCEREEIRENRSTVSANSQRSDANR